MNRMKIEEAIKLLKNMHFSITTKMNREVASSIALNIAIEALEKQAPKKTIEGYRFPEKMRKAIRKTGDIHHLADEKAPCCPICGQSQRISEIIKKRDGVEIGNPFCWKCGQALKWGEQE